MSDIASLQVKVFTQEQQLAMCVEMLKTLAMDVRILRSDSDRARERDAVYDRWVKAMPLVFAGLSGIYWVLSHMR